ncbi:MAG: alpha/beta fold hydrolase [Polaromonas sp.]
MNKQTQTAPLVLLPGLMCDATFWQPLVDFLPSQVVDYGDANSITAMAAAVLAVAPASFVLAGHSMGGRVALEVVRLAPERVQKIILMDTGYLPRQSGVAGDTEKAGRMALLDVAQQQGVRAMAQQWVKGMVHPDRLNDAPLIDAILTMMERKTADRFARQQHALLTRPDASPGLGALRIPTLLLCGRQDSWTNVAQHAAMQALVPHAQLSVIEDAGHMVLMERPEATFQVLHQFLEHP